MAGVSDVLGDQARVGHAQCAPHTGLGYDPGVGSHPGQNDFEIRSSRQGSEVRLGCGGIFGDPHVRNEAELCECLLVITGVRVGPHQLQHGVR